MASTPYQFTNPSPNEISQTLHDAKVIAVVGLSPDPSRPSYRVARYLLSQGYRIVPVTPNAEEVLGERAYPELQSIPFDIDIVDVFRRSDQVGPHVDEAIAKGVKTVWLQLGIRNDEAAQRAEQAGIRMIMDRCIAVDHRNLCGVV